MNTNLRNRTTNVNPLLMNYTPATKIEEEHSENCQIIYDDIQQITSYDMRTVGTRSLKTVSTRKKNQGFLSSLFSGDQKQTNAIDDMKSVR